MSRLLGSVLVAAAIGCSAQPVRALFDGTTWLPRLAIVLAVVAVTGAIARARLTPPRVVGAQAIAYLAVLVALFHADTLALGVLPTPSTVAHWNALLVDAGETLREHAAPAPATPGVTFLLTGAIGAIALVADALAVTLRRPALAGLPILAPFLVAVGNGDGGLHPGYFVSTAACWLALLALHDRERVLAWAAPAGAAAPHGRAGPAHAVAGGRAASPKASAANASPAPAALTGMARGARRGAASAVIGAAAITIALVVATAVPHLPVRYLADGFGTGGLGGRGRVGFSPSAQMVQDLMSTEGRPILRYRTDDPAPPPLRVSVSTTYVDGQWEPDVDSEPPSDSPQLRFPLGWSQQETKSTQQRVGVVENRLDAPYLAAPPDVIEGRVYEAKWTQGRTTGVLRVDSTPPRYDLRYLALDPDADRLRDQAMLPYPRSVLASLDEAGVTPTVRQTAVRVTRDLRGSAYDQALAIQEWLRTSGGFTYSLELAPPPAGMSGVQVRATAVDRFLRTKRGYCVQFSTAMVLMARSIGIPARIATGFLPGAQIDGTRRVLASDAHAWPELYFPGTGWLRFEPTPGTRSGTPPAYTIATPQGSGGTPSAAPSTASPTPSAGRSASAAPRPQDRDTDAGAPVPAQGQRATWPLVAGLVLLLGALLAAAPLAARRSRRRLTSQSGTGGPAAPSGHSGSPSPTSATPTGERPDAAVAVEAAWQDLLDRLADLGLDPDPAATLQGQRTQIRTAAALRGDPDQALARLVEQVEAARYAPPGAVDAPAARRARRDALTVRREAVRSRGAGTRLRALLWPGAGVRELGASWSALAARVRDPRGRAAGPDGRGSGTPDAGSPDDLARFAGRPEAPAARDAHPARR